MTYYDADRDPNSRRNQRLAAWAEHFEEDLREQTLEEFSDELERRFRGAFTCPDGLTPAQVLDRLIEWTVEDEVEAASNVTKADFVG